MILFFDLDGPILDVSSRYIVLHHELLQTHGVEGMDRERYWTRKRARRSEEEILAELGVSTADDYASRRLALIETAAYLRHDRCWPWALEILASLAPHASLVMVTARADRTALLAQLEELRLTSYFHEILSEPGGVRVDQQKAALITDYLSRHRKTPAGHWMIGDTEADVLAGKLAGLRTVAVLSGIRDRDHLRLAEPDFLLEDIRDLPRVLEMPATMQEKTALKSALS